MWGKAAFVKRLRGELPVWQAQGWVSDEAGEEILAHYDVRGEQASLISAAFGVLGALLLLSGVITFFAANWDAMPKLVKLLLLLVALLGSYLLAIRPFDQDRYPRLWASMLLLGAGMFGANIMLVAQIYHIDSHYPNGVLFWSLGALLLAWLVPAQPVMVMALALAALWTGMESLGFDHVNLAFLLLLPAALPRIGMQRWRVAAHAAGLALLLWSLFAYLQATDYGDGAFSLLVTELMFIAYLVLFVAGLLLQHWPRARQWGPLVQHYGVLGALGAFYLLTSPRLHSGLSWWSDEVLRAKLGADAMVMVVVALLVLGALTAWHHVLSGREYRQRLFDWARWLLGGCVVLLIATLFAGGGAGGYIAMGFNLFYFAGLVWLVVAGVQLQDRVLVNLAFVFFALTLITRYFDTFWTLMNRSFFFMAGGLLLLGLGFVLERQRRDLTGRIAAQHIEPDQLGGA